MQQNMISIVCIKVGKDSGRSCNSFRDKDFDPLYNYNGLYIKCKLITENFTLVRRMVR